MTETKSYYDWELELRKKSHKGEKMRKEKQDYNDLGISADDFKRFIKLWRRKNIVF